MATKKVTPATKKTETAKVESVKAEEVKTPVTEAAEEKKAPEKKAPAKKAAITAKKTTTKKTTAKKEIKVSTYVQCYGKQVEEKEIIASVKKSWTKSGKKVGDIKTMELYIKPEENAVYYVINGTETGAVEF